ncbi:MAG: hypothetical protein CMI54_00590 [Parcubacteria group bacterium]|nr:hypothetical protein [Parcubacteria group bacterium]|tara:strand:+ start:329 stop:658 length:330 start_codon:yes stop_codon:yes gene_type:complete
MTGEEYEAYVSQLEAEWEEGTIGTLIKSIGQLREMSRDVNGLLCVLHYPYAKNRHIAVTYISEEKRWIIDYEDFSNADFTDSDDFEEFEPDVHYAIYDNRFGTLKNTRE